MRARTSSPGSPHQQRRAAPPSRLTASTVSSAAVCAATSASARAASGPAATPSSKLSRIHVTRARSSGSRSSVSTSSSSRATSSRWPSSNASSAARRRRSARRPGCGLSAAARSSAAIAARPLPRCCAEPAASSSSAATPSSGPTREAARCHARRSWLVDQHLRQRGVRREPLGEARRLVDRRAHERVAEAQGARVDLDELRRDRRGQLPEPALAARRRSRPPRAPRPRRRRRRSAATVSSVRVASGRPATRADERLLEPLGQRQPGRQQGALAERRPSRPGSSTSASGLPARVGQQALADGRRQRGPAGIEHGGGRSVVEPLEPQLGQAGVLEARREAGAHAREQHDRVRAQAPRDEREHLGARRVEPVRVLHDQQEGGRGGGLRHEIEHGQRDQEAIGRGRVAHPERRQERRALGRRELRGAAEDRAQQLVQARERQVRLGLDAGRPQHLHLARGRALGHRGQQRGLADTRLAAHDERAASIAHPVDERREQCDLAITAEDAVGGCHAPPMGVT